MDGKYEAPHTTKLIVCDADGTLCRTKKGGAFRHGADDWELIPGVKDSLDHHRQRGIAFAVASNQGGVAFGLLRKEDIDRELRAMGEQLGIPPAFVFFCCTHPNGRYPEFKVTIDHDRKPQPGMIRSAMALAEVMPEHTLMVGDRPEDEQSAHAAGVRYVPANLFFCGWTDPEDYEAVTP